MTSSSTTTLAIDPGTHQSAFVVLESSGRVLDHAKLDNEKLLEHIRSRELHADALAVEMIASYGRPVGSEVFLTCVWIGRFVESWGRDHLLCYRKDVCAFLCGSSQGVNDGVIRQRIIDLYGPGRDVAVGTVKTPGPLHGVKADVWQALAVGLYAQAQLRKAGAA